MSESVLCWNFLGRQVMLASAEEKRAQADKMADQVGAYVDVMVLCGRASRIVIFAATIDTNLALFVEFLSHDVR